MATAMQATSELMAQETKWVTVVFVTCLLVPGEVGLRAVLLEPAVPRHRRPHPGLREAL